MEQGHVVDDILVIGAGPAGLTAAYKASAAGSLRIRVLEADPTYVGGISRTEHHEGFSFDIGGHRFFSKSEEIEALWREMLPQDFMLRSRLSRIYYNGKFFSYPLKAVEAFLNLGPVESCLCGLSYIWARINPVKNPKSFAEWVSNKFGKRLFAIFFKTYTEKVWGMSCDELSADWAAQRIKGLNLSQAVLASLRKSLGGKASRHGGETIKTLTEEFHYPRLGPGMLWEAAAAKAKQQGAVIQMGQRVVGLRYDRDAGVWHVRAVGTDGADFTYQARTVLSTAPMRDLVAMIEPKPNCAESAKGLRYRDFLTVALKLNAPVPFKDNWIYIHDPAVLVGRIQNFGAWSDSLLPDAGKGCLGFEYFCNEGDDLWSKPDSDLVALATQELSHLGIVDASTVFGGVVVRQPKTYPVYDDAYAAIVASIRDEMDQTYPTLHFIGRNGMHKYDNQDHAMMTAILTVKNILAGKRIYDVWSVNEDAEYHEEMRS